MVSETLHPGFHVFGERTIPGFLKHILIHEGITVEAFQGGADAHEVVTTFLESAFNADVDRVEVAGKHGVASEVAEVTPDVRHAVVGFGAFPHGLSFAVVIEHDVPVFRHGGDVGLYAVVHFPVLTLVPEEPCHFKPSCVRVSGFQ